MTFLAPPPMCSEASARGCRGRARCPRMPMPTRQRPRVQAQPACSRAMRGMAGQSHELDICRCIFYVFFGFCMPLMLSRDSKKRKINMIGVASRP